MSHYSKIFNRVPIKVPNRNGFDKSFEHILSQKTGTLVPVLCDEIIPNTTISLGCLAQIQLPPMATDFYGRIDYKLEAFFVPGRLLFGGFEDVFTHQTSDLGIDTESYENRPKFIPGINLPVNPETDVFLAAGSLADYLGYKVITGSSLEGYYIDNILPFVCYHLIWSEWYRDSRVQRNPFGLRRPNSSTNNLIAYLPKISALSSSNDEAIAYNVHLLNAGQISFLDSVNLFSLRQRNFAKDRFTNSTPLAQAGTPSQLEFKVDTTTGDGAFTIASLRAANSLQQWLEMNNLAGARYGDQQKAEFGVYPESFKCDRPIYLGSKTIQIYNRSVYQTEGSTAQTQSRNPFNELGSKGASSMGVGDGSLIDKFTATERGYLMVMASVVPHANYASGVNPMFRRYRVGDFAHPLFQGIGDEPVYSEEVVESPYIPAIPSELGEFGYTQRFSSYKYKDDVVSGLLRSGQSLEAFALKRSFVPGSTISTSFLEIPTDFLDEVTAVDGDSSQYGAWADIYFKYKVSMPLSAYTIPTLGDMKDTHSEVVNNGGTRL